MTKGPLKNIAASVRQRLANAAKAENRRFGDVLQYFALERWLFRLAQSSFRDRFILKGALLFVLWKAPTTRPTRDIDLLGRLNNDLEYIQSVIAEICSLTSEADALAFDVKTIATERIAEEADYHGVRATFQAMLGNARIPMQVDIGFSDVITPAPVSVSYPTLLGFPTANLLAYNRETAIAEKFEAMVKLGELNSRMKDFFDCAVLAANYDFDGRALTAAVQATFQQRHTQLQLEPVCFAKSFSQDVRRIAQWNAFIRRNLIPDAKEFPAIIDTIRAFLQPIADSAVNRVPIDLRWDGGGPWRKTAAELGSSEG